MDQNWLVSFNPNKTSIILFTKADMHSNPTLVFGTKILNITDTHKHLGLTFLANVKWTIHINNICKSASVFIFYLFHC